MSVQLFPREETVPADLDCDPLLQRLYELTVPLHWTQWFPLSSPWMFNCNDIKWRDFACFAGISSMKCEHCWVNLQCYVNAVK